MPFVKEHESKIDFVAAGLGNDFGNAAEDEEDEEMVQLRRHRLQSWTKRQRRRNRGRPTGGGVQCADWFGCLQCQGCGRPGVELVEHHLPRGRIFSSGRAPHFATRRDRSFWRPMNTVGETGEGSSRTAPHPFLRSLPTT